MADNCANARNMLRDLLDATLSQDAETGHDGWAIRDGENAGIMASASKIS